MRPAVKVATLTLASSLLVGGGVVYAAPQQELSVAAGLDSAFDDNVYNSRGPDFVNRVAPHASYRLLDPRAKFAASYDLGYWTYAFGKAQNSINHRADLSVERKLTRQVTL